jgi:hypothetical protein
VAGGCRYEPVNNLGRDIHGGVEPEGHVGSPNVVIDRLGKADDVEPSSEKSFAVLWVRFRPGSKGSPAHFL